MKFQNLSVKRLFGRVALGLVLSMSGIDVYKRQALIESSAVTVYTEAVLRITGGKPEWTMINQGRLYRR